MLIFFTGGLARGFMKTLGFVSSIIALLGIIAHNIFGEATPAFVVPMVVVSLTLSIFFVTAGILSSINAATRRNYRCVQCGLFYNGNSLKKAGNICPMCGSNVFA